MSRSSEETCSSSLARVQGAGGASADGGRPRLGSTANNCGGAGRGRSRSEYFRARQCLRRWLWANSSVDRVRMCGRVAWRSEIKCYGVGDGAYFGGVVTCGSVHACPVCAPTVRARRAAELSWAFEEYVARGGGLVFVSLTTSHGVGHALSVLWKGLPLAFRRMLDTRAMRDFRDRHPFEFVRAFEVTYGRLHGWHPHLHLALLTLEPWTPEVVREFRTVLFESWRATLGRMGLPLPSVERGVDVRPACSGAVGRYLTKVSGLGSELVRGDTKRGREGRYGPFELLAAAASGEGWASERWREFERTTKGARALQFSGSARAVLRLGEVVSDEVTAALPETDNEPVLIGTLTLLEWASAQAWPDALAAVYTACTDHSVEEFERVRAFLRSHPPWWVNRVTEAEAREQLRLWLRDMRHIADILECGA